MYSNPPKGKSNVGLYVGGGLIAAGLAWLLWPRQAGAVSAPYPATPGTSKTPSPAPQSQSTPTQSPPNTADQENALITRLQLDSNARDIFNFQSLNFEFGVTEAPPDGVMGPVTQGLIRQVYDTMNTPAPTGQYTPWTQIMPLARQAVQLISRASSPLREIPMALPNDVIRAVNQNALAADPQAFLLQAEVLDPNVNFQVTSG